MLLISLLPSLLPLLVKAWNESVPSFCILVFWIFIFSRKKAFHFVLSYLILFKWKWKWKRKDVLGVYAGNPIGELCVVNYGFSKNDRKVIFWYNVVLGFYLNHLWFGYSNFISWSVGEFRTKVLSVSASRSQLWPTVAAFVFNVKDGDGIWSLV